MIGFNDSSIYVGQIKEMLSSFWLPTCAVVPSGMEPKAYLGLTSDNNHNNHINYIHGNALFLWDGSKERRISSYKAGDFIPNLTKRLEIRNNYYDSYTHAYLGDFLRYVRDYLGVDLMGMYNCFTWDMPKYVDSLMAEEGKVFSSNDGAYDLYMFPARFDKEYTIAADWHGRIEVCACLYDANIVLNQASDDKMNNGLAKATYASFSGMRFSRPVLYTGLKDKRPENFSVGESAGKLKLFVKVPRGCESSIVFLEGDWRGASSTYLSQTSTKVIKSRTILSLEVPGTDGDLPDEDKAEGFSGFDYISKSQLLSTNDGERNQLADRLVEYLSSNVVSPLDPITRNIAKLQAKYEAEGRFDRCAVASRLDGLGNHHGVWDDALRRATWAYEDKSGMLDDYYDLLGYFDKDAEAKMGGLRIEGGEED